MQGKQEKDREHFKTPNAVPPIVVINEHMPQSTRRENGMYCSFSRFQFPQATLYFQSFFFFDIGTKMHKRVRILRQIMQNYLKSIFAWVWFCTWAVFCSLVYLCCWQNRISYVGCSDREDDSPLRGFLSRLSGRLQMSVEHSSREKAVSKRTCLASTEACVWSPEPTKTVLGMMEVYMWYQSWRSVIS